MLLNFWAAKGGSRPATWWRSASAAGASVIAAIEKGEVDGVSQTDPALTHHPHRQEPGEGAGRHAPRPRATRSVRWGVPGRQPLFANRLHQEEPGHGAGARTGIVRANQWLQTATPADVANAVPEGYLLGDRAVYEKSFAGVRETISPDGTMPAGAMEKLPQVPGERATGDQAGDREARRYLEQRIRPARRQAQLVRRDAPGRAGARAGRHHLPLRRTRRDERTLHRRCNTTLNIARGEFVSVVGPTGCGKSTC